jgi:hypothetical protein
MLHALLWSKRNLDLIKMKTWFLVMSPSCSYGLAPLFVLVACQRPSATQFLD